MTGARLQQVYEAQLAEALEHRDEKGFDVAGFRLLPGRKVLVFGNHDRSAKGFDIMCGSVYSHGEPPLVLTHVPLRRVPPACVNVHGHLHARLVTGSTAHVNVSVEQLDYRPRRLTDIRRLADPPT